MKWRVIEMALGLHVAIVGVPIYDKGWPFILFVIFGTFLFADALSGMLNDKKEQK